MVKPIYYINLVGKICSKNARRYINEEEELDNISDSRSMDILANSSSTWIRNVVHRNTQVAPEGNFFKILHNALIQSEVMILFVLRFYGTVNPLGSSRARVSIPNLTLTGQA